MTAKDYKILADTIANIENYEERLSTARLFGDACAKDNVHFNWDTWNKACGINGRFESEISRRINFWIKLKERLDRNEKSMVILVKGEAVDIPCNQCAIVKEVVKESFNKIEILVKLLETDTEAFVLPRHIVGIELDETLTIMFEYAGHVNKRLPITEAKEAKE